MVQNFNIGLKKAVLAISLWRAYGGLTYLRDPHAHEALFRAESLKGRKLSDFLADWSVVGSLMLILRLQKIFLYSDQSEILVQEKAFSVNVILLSLKLY